jgi:hypothetical protein
MVYSILFFSSAGLLQAFLKEIEFQIAMIAVLHTRGQDLILYWFVAF